MRIVLVGPARARARLRERAEVPMEVVGEFSNVAVARASGVAFDAMLVAAERDEEDALTESLTSREIDVLELLVEGLSNKSIAERLGISDQTVKFHVSSITGKLGARNRTDAVRRAIRRGLVTL
jgi:DNA-binding NarL/FixJ family response regulator